MDDREREHLGDLVKGWLNATAKKESPDWRERKRAKRRLTERLRRSKNLRGRLVDGFEGELEDARLERVIDRWTRDAPYLRELLGERIGQDERLRFYLINTYELDGELDWPLRPRAHEAGDSEGDIRTRESPAPCRANSKRENSGKGGRAFLCPGSEYLTLDPRANRIASDMANDAAEQWAKSNRELSQEQWVKREEKEGRL